MPILTEAETGSPEFWAEKTPDAVAVISGNEQLSYKEWNTRANKMANSLAKHDLKPGDRLGMRFRLGIDWFVAQRALQKLGIVQVAVNYRLTADEALYILHDSGAKGMLCDDNDPRPWLKHNIGLLITFGQAESAKYLRYEDLVAEGETTPRFGAARPQMVMYTSGTTGYPKGVPPPEPPKTDAEKDRVNRFLESIASRPKRPDGRRVVMLSLPVHHGAGPLNSTVATATGGTTVLLSPFDPLEALRLIEKYRVNMWTAVPTMLQRIRSLSSEVVANYDVSSIETLITGAAPVGSALVKWVIEVFGPDVLWETYGLSEAGIVGAISPREKLDRPGCSARVHDGAEVIIVDHEWNELPAYEIGEIAVSTPFVLKNYIGKPLLGLEVLRDGFYKTGDAGYLDKDGYLYITDRIKDMIVAGGVNIYPAEIEKVIASHEDVRTCAVIGIPQEEFGEQPMAYVIRRHGSILTEDHLREYIAVKLARYKHPRIYKFVDDLPLNTVGKINKVELRDKYWQGHERKI
ncbi:MAG: class I adenylate-forming enzyme family protein [Gammaproteobacteria bacterium]|nr:class I adenylate-forming enzyme family protein [Gammaproteobacteria bacterium]